MGGLGGAVFPLCCLTWGQTMVAVMKIMLPSFKRSHAGTAALSSHDPAAGPSRPMSLPETPGHSQASLDQSLVGPLLLSPGFWYAQGFICALESVSPVLCKFWRLCGGVNGGLLSPRGLMSYPGLLHPEPLTLQHFAPHLYLHRRHSNAVSAQSLLGIWVLVHTSFDWALWASLAGMGLDYKWYFTSPTTLLGLLLFPWMWDIFFGGIQYSPVDGCLGMICNFGVLAGEDEHMSFYSTIL